MHFIIHATKRNLVLFQNGVPGTRMVFRPFQSCSLCNFKGCCDSPCFSEVVSWNLVFQAQLLISLVAQVKPFGEWGDSYHSGPLFIFFLLIGDLSDGLVEPSNHLEPLNSHCGQLLTGTTQGLCWSWSTKQPLCIAAASSIPRKFSRAAGAGRSLGKGVPGLLFLPTVCS